MNLHVPSFLLGLAVVIVVAVLVLPLVGRRMRSIAARGHKRELAEMAAERDRLRAEVAARDRHGAQAPIGDLTADEEDLRRRIDALADELVRTTGSRRTPNATPTPDIARGDDAR